MGKKRKRRIADLERRVADLEIKVKAALALAVHEEESFIAARRGKSHELSLDNGHAEMLESNQDECDARD